MEKLYGQSELVGDADKIAIMKRLADFLGPKRGNIATIFTPLFASGKNINLAPL